MRALIVACTLAATALDLLSGYSPQRRTRLSDGLSEQPLGGVVQIADCVSRGVSPYRFLSLPLPTVTVILPRTLRCPAALAVLLLLALPSASQAQSLWSTPYVPDQITLEVLQPTLQSAPSEDISVLTGASTLWGSYLITDRMTVVAGMPVARYQSTRAGEPPTDVTETQIGNPYVGLGVSSTRVPLLVELGVRLPLASEAALATRAGQATDLAHREAFAPDLFAAQIIANTRWGWTRRFGFRFRGGPLLTTPTQDVPGTTEVYARYGVQAWQEGDRLVAGVGLAGRALLSERGGSFTDRTTHQATGTLIWNLPPVQPGLLIRLPINEPDGAGVDVVVGLTLSVTL